MSIQHLSLISVVIVFYHMFAGCSNRFILYTVDRLLSRLSAEYICGIVDFDDTFKNKLGLSCAKLSTALASYTLA